MSHSYEEIRGAVFDSLSGKIVSVYGLNQYTHLKISAAQALRERSGFESRGQTYAGRDPQLSSEDANVFLEVFWDLFRQGVITLGLDDANPAFPFFRITSLGKQILENEQTYFIHDVSAYETRIKKEIPGIDSVTLLYLKEALQAFRSGCILSATVMLGVATEHTFLLLIEAIDNSPIYATGFSPVAKKRTILEKFNCFRKLLEPQLNALERELREDLDTNLSGILSLIRNFRNESGHPSGKIIDREQAYVLLQLFLPYCKKMYKLKEHFGK